LERVLTLTRGKEIPTIELYRFSMLVDESDAATKYSQVKDLMDKHGAAHMVLPKHPKDVVAQIDVLTDKEDLMTELRQHGALTPERFIVTSEAESRQITVRPSRTAQNPMAVLTTARVHAHRNHCHTWMRAGSIRITAPTIEARDAYVAAARQEEDLLVFCDVPPKRSYLSAAGGGENKARTNNNNKKKAAPVAVVIRTLGPVAPDRMKAAAASINAKIVRAIGFDEVIIEIEGCVESEQGAPQKLPELNPEAFEGFVVCRSTDF
jgi:hypothetical protein